MTTPTTPRSASSTLLVTLAACLAIEPGGQLDGLGVVAIEYPQFADAEPSQRKGNRLADTAGADHGDGAMRRGSDEFGDGSRET